MRMLIAMQVCRSTFPPGCQAACDCRKLSIQNASTFALQDDVEMSLDMPSQMMSPRSSTEAPPDPFSDMERAQETPTESNSLLTPLRPYQTASTSDECVLTS